MANMRKTSKVKRTVRPATYAPEGTKKVTAYDRSVRNGKALVKITTGGTPKRPKGSVNVTKNASAREQSSVRRGVAAAKRSNAKKKK